MSLRFRCSSRVTKFNTLAVVNTIVTSLQFVQRTPYCNFGISIQLKRVNLYGWPRTYQMMNWIYRFLSGILGWSLIAKRPCVSAQLKDRSDTTISKMVKEDQSSMHKWLRIADIYIR